MKLSLQYVAREVDKLYEKQFDASETGAIEKHCEFIRDFINACGWDEDDLLRAMYPSNDPRLSQELRVYFCGICNGYHCTTKPK